MSRKAPAAQVCLSFSGSRLGPEHRGLSPLCRPQASGTALRGGAARRPAAVDAMNMAEQGPSLALSAGAAP